MRIELGRQRRPRAGMLDGALEPCARDALSRPPDCRRSIFRRSLRGLGVRRIVAEGKRRLNKFAEQYEKRI
jgi:hypothetical protein